MRHLFPILLLALSCSGPNSEESTSSSNPFSQQEYSTGWQAEEFQEKDSQISAVLAALPDMDSIFAAHMERLHWPGVTWGIVYRDSLITKGSLGVMDINTKAPASAKSYFRIASMSKSFTAMAILKLRDEGKLSLDDRVDTYIPEFMGLIYPTEDAPILTLRHLLTMSSGFPEDNAWGDRQLDVNREAFSAFLEGGITFSSVPGTQYEYSNLGYGILGEIVTRTSSMPYQEYITSQIFQPLGMNETVWEYETVEQTRLAKGYRWEDEQWKDEPMLHDGVYGSMGGIITTMDDFAKYVSFHLSAWPPRNGDEAGPLKRSSVREMHQMTFPRLVSGTKPSVVGYGFGLRITKESDGNWSAGHGGALPGFGSNYFFYPELGIGFIGFCNLTYTPPTPALTAVKDHLFTKGIPNRYEIPVSSVLEQRKSEVIKLITTWDEKVEEDLVAMNFYMDEDKAHRKASVAAVLEKIGEIESVGELEPLNRLRGSFEIKGKNGVARVFFTLTPEKDARLQRLEIFDF